MTVKSSISLSDEQHAFAKALVDAGRFSSVSAVLQRGVDLLRQQDEADALERLALADVLTLRRAGPFVTGGEMDSALAAMLERKRLSHDIPG